MGARFLSLLDAPMRLLNLYLLILSDHPLNQLRQRQALDCPRLGFCTFRRTGGSTDRRICGSHLSRVGIARSIENKQRK